MSALKVDRVLYLWNLRSKGMSAPSVDWILVALTAIVDRNVNGILVAPKGTVDRNVIFHCWQGFGSSESYGYKVHKDPHVRGIVWFTVWWTNKWRKWKLRIALQVLAVWELTENKSFKCTPTIHIAQLH